MEPKIKVEDYIDGKTLAFLKVAFTGLGIVFAGAFLGLVMKALGLLGTYNLPVIFGFVVGCVYVGWFATKGYPRLKKLWEKRDEYLNKHK